jgi:hypothetical protein
MGTPQTSLGSKPKESRSSKRMAFTFSDDEGLVDFELTEDQIKLMNSGQWVDAPGEKKYYDDIVWDQKAIETIVSM